MSKLPIVSGADCVRALEKIGFVVDRQRGSHIILVREDPRTTVSIPNYKELDRGTLRAIPRQVGLSVDEFSALL
ncbi:MAG: type II toxin-antitoxin system HicA family toxin [Phormidesmis sp. CAN_BIN36]|nr:type II toxin-antitoxin system HicA family toxin [Phormidesmis sp. CAN_BIN36]